MSSAKSFVLSIGLLMLLLLSSSAYVVTEGEKGLLLRLGELVDDSSGKPGVKGPGLHFKFPLIYTARLFDTRLQTLDIKSSRIVTQEKKDVLVDYFVKWRIQNLPLYFTRTGGNQMSAETLLEQKLNDGLRAEFGKRTITEVVSGERSDIMKSLQKVANDSAASLGIEVVDVRIKRIDLPSEVSTAVFDRMRAEREQIANEHRAQGRADAEVIRAKADAEVSILIAKAMSNSKSVRGLGDAQAAKIYAEAYNQDPKFYAFYRSLQAYHDVFKDKTDVIVLRPDSQFFKYFNKSNS